MEILKNLKEQTQELHTKAEEHPLMSSFKDRSYKKEHLLMYLVNLRPVYESVEQCLLIPYIHKNFDLCRSRHISKDIAMLYKENVVSDINNLVPLKCTKEWVRGQWEVSSSMLVADLYVRWLADFYGGRMFAKTLDPYNNTFNCSTDTGSVIADVRNIIAEKSLVESNVDPYYKEKAIVNRAVSFFAFHVELFNQIYYNH
jgi:heme oxygenase